VKFPTKSEVILQLCHDLHKSRLVEHTLVLSPNNFVDNYVDIHSNVVIVSKNLLLIYFCSLTGYSIAEKIRGILPRPLVFMPLSQRFYTNHNIFET